MKRTLPLTIIALVFSCKSFTMQTFRLVVFFCITPLFANDYSCCHNSTKIQQETTYKDCEYFKLEAASKDCKFINKLNTDVQTLEQNNEIYYITRYVNDATKKIAFYDIVGDEEGNFLEIDYTQEIEGYLVYLEKAHLKVVINTQYD